MSTSQSQESLIDQLRAMVVIANTHGYYDAADWIRDQIKKTIKEDT